jgi:cell division protein FtsW
MGGSSFLFTCLSIGIILSVARNVEQLEGKAALAAENNSEDDVQSDVEPSEETAVKALVEKSSRKKKNELIEV